VFLSPEELEQGEKYGKLPVEDSCGSHVEGIYVEGQDRKQVGEERNWHAGTCKTGKPNEPDQMRQDWPQSFYAIYQGSANTIYKM